jgi:hypothetical protein
MVVTFHNLDGDRNLVRRQAATTEAMDTPLE